MNWILCNYLLLPKETLPRSWTPCQFRAVHKVTSLSHIIPWSKTFKRRYNTIFLLQIKGWFHKEITHPCPIQYTQVLLLQPHSLRYCAYAVMFRESKTYITESVFWQWLLLTSATLLSSMSWVNLSMVLLQNPAKRKVCLSFDRGHGSYLRLSGQNP